jgi:hypothetical protein
MLSLLIYGVIMLMFAVSLRRPAKALIEARRQHANLQRALAASDEVGEDPFRHLTPPLARLAEETRVLRSLLEEPIQAALAWRSADDSPILSKVDFGDGSDLDRCDDFDVALVNARQAVWSWISAVAALPEADRMRLDELGLSDREARALLGGSDGAAPGQSEGSARARADRGATEAADEQPRAVRIWVSAQSGLDLSLEAALEEDPVGGDGRADLLGLRLAVADQEQHACRDQRGASSGERGSTPRGV